jgi:hypothetical protein
MKRNEIYWNGTKQNEMYTKTGILYPELSFLLR